MPRFDPTEADFLTVDIGGKPRKLLSRATYDAFNSSLLGLGDIKQDSITTDAIAAIFDLQGFTNFCKQIEPQLSVPLFLSQFLDWLLADIKKEMTQAEYEKGAHLYCPLPFFVKFMGDGVLVLWDASKTNDTGRRNIIVSAYQICQHYSLNFLQGIKSKVVEPPGPLRCGLARGTVYSVGDGHDFVGSCINMAARIQKLSGTTFAFNRRGFDLEDKSAIDFFTRKIVVKQMTVRGIGDFELIAILRSEFDAMDSREKKQFRDV